jgi:hypothetical protein
MQKYNELIKRWHKEEKFFEDENVSMEKKEQYIPDIKILTNHLGGILDKLVEMGYQPTHSEILEGFKEE